MSTRHQTHPDYLSLRIEVIPTPVGHVADLNVYTTDGEGNEVPLSSMSQISGFKGATEPEAWAQRILVDLTDMLARHIGH